MNALDEGKATYSGPATGLFAKKSGSIYTMSGQFMADTVLKVEFGVPDPNDPEDKETLVIISGEVTDFTDIDSNIIDSDWKVTLQEVVHSPSGVYEGGETDGGGKWDFQFYGDLNTIDNPVQPAIIGGGFDNEFSNGVVAGVFATTK